MFLFFLKVGALMFGSGYVLVAFLHTDLVVTPAVADGRPAFGRHRRRPVHAGTVARHRHFHWIYSGRSPGGRGGHGGDFPSGLCAGGHQRAARTAFPPIAAANAFFDGVNVASLALIAVVTWRLGSVALVDWLTISLAVAAVIWLLFYRVNSTWLILAGAAMGLARFVFQNGL